MKIKVLKEQFSINESGLSRIWQYTQKGMNFAIIGTQDQDAEKDRTNDLQYEIEKLSDKRKNITFRVLTGTYTYEDGSADKEISYLIYNLSIEDAIRIGRKLNQDSIIWKDNDFFGFIDMATCEPDGEFSEDERNTSFSKDAVKIFSSRLNPKHSKGQRFVFKASELVNDNKGSSIKNLGGVKSHEEVIFEMNIVKSAFGTEEEYDALSPVGVVNAMFEHTDGEGRLVIPAWPYDDPDGIEDKTLIVTMDWNKEDLEDLKTDYEELLSALESIASVWDKLGSTEEYNRKLLSARDFAVWNTYIRAFDTGDVDAEEVFDVMEGIGAGTTVYCSEDEELCARYAEAIYADSESRLDSPLAAYDVIIRAKRLCRLMSLEAPECVINNEAKLLVQAMAVNKYGKSTRLL